MKLKFNFNKRNRYKNICSIEGCNNSACGKYCNKHYHQIKRYIVLLLKNGLKIKILFVGVVDYLNIKIMFLPVDILVFVFYSNMILTKDGCLNLHKSLIVLK